MHGHVLLRRRQPYRAIVPARVHVHHLFGPRVALLLYDDDVAARLQLCDRGLAVVAQDHGLAIHQDFTACRIDPQHQIGESSLGVLVRLRAFPCRRIAQGELAAFDSPGYHGPLVQAFLASPQAHMLEHILVRLLRADAAIAVAIALALQRLGKVVGKHTVPESVIFVRFLRRVA